MILETPSVRDRGWTVSHVGNFYVAAANMPHLELAREDGLLHAKGGLALLLTPESIFRVFSLTPRARSVLWGRDNRTVQPNNKDTMSRNTFDQKHVNSIATDTINIYEQH